MLFNSIDFLIFFPIVVAVFFCIPRKVRYIWLLAASYYFYMSWNPKYAILIAISTVTTYYSGIIIEKHTNNKSILNLSLILNLVINLGILGVFKYANFAIQNLSAFFLSIGISPIEKRFDFLLPVGISFYTFQAISYSIDVYRGQIKAERNILKYALFVSFFPQLVAGPIERSTNLLPQIQNVDKFNLWNFNRVRDGFFLMMWGFFQKLVIADRASIVVDNVINNYSEFGFVEISIAAVLFAFQIYCDFGGYTNIARGAAKVMGFELMNNFRQPYLATSIKEFWRRWHISLTTWFTDYLYIPLGGNRRGVVRKYINIAIVFGVSGLWHGASWNFVAWGCIHALCQIVEDLMKPLKKISENRIVGRIINTIATFVLVDFAWLFFVCGSLRQAIGVIKQMITVAYTKGLMDIGFDVNHWIVILLAVITLIAVDVIHENKIAIFAEYDKLNVVIRWCGYFALIWAIILFGIYGVEYDASSFIYFQF